MRNQRRIHDRTNPDDGGIVIVGDDDERIEDAIDEFTSGVAIESDTAVHADGGIATEHGPVEVYEAEGPPGHADLDAALHDEGTDRIVLAFEDADRDRFFPTLRACRERDAEAIVPADQAQSVLVERRHGEWVTANVKPLPPWQRTLKRLFDVAFASVGLLALAPLIAAIAVAIKLDSPGPVLYRQRRTARFGEPFTVYKFRSMIADAEADTGATLSSEDTGGTDPRVTRVGYVLRTTHMDEIPQLWAILRGEMSVVGPRPERPELDSEIRTEAIAWEKRWFVKPGLTGLAQINGATGHEPNEKLRYDLEYIHRRSFRLDVWIVVRQLWTVAEDVWKFISSK